MGAKQIILFSILLLPNVVRADETFRSFQVKHKKTYSSDSEMVLRQQIFNSNLKKIQEHNKKYQQGLVSYEMGINQFSDLTEEEFASRLRTWRLNDSLLENADFQDSSKMNLSELPQSVDWRNNGIVTYVKDQGQCGGCWAFSTTGSLEGQLALKKGNLTYLSEQQLIDCTRENKGCGGGALQYAFEYAISNGLTTEAAYPYIAMQGYCRHVGDVVVRPWGYVAVPRFNETELKLAVGLIGPVSVAVNARPLQYYTGGIYDGACSSDVNHGVLVVGYGTDNRTSTDYWIIKNSWGIGWGENGYYRLAMGEGLCGITLSPVYPILDPPPKTTSSSPSSLGPITSGSRQFLNGLFVILCFYHLLRTNF